MKFTSKTYHKILTVLSLLALSWAGYKIFYFQNEKKDILEDHSFAIGEITDYDIVGDIKTHYLSYKYLADSIEYRGRIVNPKKHFEKCTDNVGYCISYRFWVIYSNGDHSKSLIDVTHDISNDSVLIPPLDLSKFQ